MLSLSVTLGALLSVVGAPQESAATAQPATQAEVKATAPAAEPAAKGAAEAASTASPAPEAKKEPEVTLFPNEASVIEHTNQQRARHGLRPLRLDRGLLGSARRHCWWMSRNNAMQHTSAPVAENIAAGQSSPTEAMNSWMNSSGHRANILNASYTRIGVAAYRSASGTTYWCQQFQR